MSVLVSEQRYIFSNLSNNVVHSDFNFSIWLSLSTNKNLVSKSSSKLIKDSYGVVQIAPKE